MKILIIHLDMSIQMFFTEQLNVIPNLLVKQAWSDSVQKKLNQEYLNLEATLLRGKVLREFSKDKITYLIQTYIESESSDLAYLFAPFIFSNLNKPMIYVTPATQSVLNILNKYYQAEQKPKFIIENVLNALKLYIDLSNLNEDGSDFFYANLLRALCRTDISTIFLISEYEIDVEKIKILADFLKIEIFIIPAGVKSKILNSQLINMRKLLFKNKDPEYIRLCALFSHKNAELLSKDDSLNFTQTTNLIEDMFYSEHIYEKLSVYAEYIQTQIQNA